MCEDYINAENGLLYCGNCNTAKQRIMNDLPDNIIAFFKGNKVPTTCKCRNIEIETQLEQCILKFIVLILQDLTQRTNALSLAK